MMFFRDTDEALTFIASGDSRETSPRIMEAIVYFAENLQEAEALWQGDFGDICHPGDFWEFVTNNGLRGSTAFHWGAAGRYWWGALLRGIDGFPLSDDPAVREEQIAQLARQEVRS